MKEREQLVPAPQGPNAAVIITACEFVEIATPFFDKYRALIPTSLAGYFARLRAACEDYRKETKGAP